LATGKNAEQLVKDAEDPMLADHARWSPAWTEASSRPIGANQ